MNIKIDLTTKTGSIGHCMKQHRDEILSVKSSSEAYTLMKNLFEAENINTPKSNQILYKLQNGGLKYADTLIYLNNIIMKSMKLGVI